MDQKQLDPILEGIKQFVRVGLIAVLPVAIEQLSEGKFEIKDLSLIFIIAVLVGIEKGLHKQGKNTGDMNVVSKALEFKSVKE